MMWGILYSLIIVIVSIVLYLYYTETARFLEGMWIADKDFMNDMGLTDLFLYIEKIQKNYMSYTATGYVITSDPDPTEFTMNIPLTYGTKYNVSVLAGEKSPLVADNNLLADKMVLEFDINNGTLILTENNVIKGVYYKVNEPL